MVTKLCYLEAAAQCVEMCTIFFVIALIIKRGNMKRLPLKIKITLFFLPLLCLYCALANLAYIFTEKEESVHSEDVERKWRIIFATYQTAWCCIQWQFVTFYLQTASLFDITFKSNCFDEVLKVQRRRKQLIVVEIVGYAINVSLCIYVMVASCKLTFLAFQLSHCLFLELIPSNIFAIVLFWSLHRIHKSSKVVETHGIKSN